MRDYIYNSAENIFQHKDELVHESSMPVVKPKETKVGSPAHRQKYPERYSHRYVSKLEQALHPKLGTAPSEKAAAKKNYK